MSALQVLLDTSVKITVVTGSRADYGLLEWPIKVLQDDPFFDIEVLKFWNRPLDGAYSVMRTEILNNRPEIVLMLGDRYEILGAAAACHLERIPIAHIAGGDVTEGSYDDAMRDAISRMATIHFVTSTSAMARLTHMGYRNVHLVGNPGIDYIKRADWKRDPPLKQPYVVVSYQAETLDGTIDFDAVLKAVAGRQAIFIMPNPDSGSDVIRKLIIDRYELEKDITWEEFLPHDEFLNLIYHCDEFIGNSSAMLYEAPELQLKTRMIGKRQRGRTIPFGDGQASERIVHVLKYGAL